MKKLILPFPDYKRIFGIINSVLLHEKAEMNHSCIYFSIIGAFILHEHYNLNAKVAMGVATYMINEQKSNVLAFAEKEDDHLICSENGFHSWIEVKDYVIDFTAPLFNEMAKKFDPHSSCKPKMFQKPLGEMCETVSELGKNGDFFLGKDMEFSDKMVDHFLSIPFNTDIISICNRWYKRPPKKIQKTIKIGDNKGNLNDLQFRTVNISGKW